MAEAEKVHPLLQKPLFIFSLPEELLNTLTIKGDDGPQVLEATPAIQEPAQGNNVPGGAGCVTCNVAVFASISQQRDHHRSDLHKFNLKRKVAGQQVVSSADFDKMLDDLNESISGSESSESTASSTNEDPLSKLLVKHTIDPTATASSTTPKFRSPLIWLSSPILPQPTSLGLYRAMFDAEDLHEDPIALIRYKQIPPSPANSPKRTIALMMIGGGHFAAIIASLTPKIQKNHSSQDERQVDVIASKTFHRYTTRRKQGGAQSANDASKGNAHSAGSSLRRYNESALQKEIRELLASWKDGLDACEFVFIRATGTANRRTLFGYDGAVLRSNDPRIRGFPFTTRRPTKTELLRCFNELMRVKVSHIDEAALTAKAKQTPTIPTTTSKPQLTEEQKEEQRLVAHSAALTTLIQRKKIPALTAYLKEHQLSPDFTLHPVSTYSHTSSLLHFASSSSLPSVVTALFTLGANPQVTNAAGKTPFEVAGDRQTRDRFRLARHSLGESKWNWEAAHIPKPLTEEAVRARDAQEQADLEKERAKKAAETKRIADEALKSSPTKTGSRTLGVPSAGNVANDRGLTMEMRAKVERERRARAAEARFSGLAKRG